MIGYEPDDAFAHRLDPRSKLAVQVGFAAAALAHTSLPALLVLTALTLLALGLARMSLRGALYSYRFALVLLAAAPLVAALALESPWFVPRNAIEPLASSYRVLLILLVSACYVRSTPIRESRAAIQRTVPGRIGQGLGVGVALVFRFFPVVLADLRTIRSASAARLGDQRGIVSRATHLGTTGLARAFTRADRLGVALQARCFSWNPTLPPLAFERRDVPVLAVAIVLGVSALL